MEKNMGMRVGSGGGAQVMAQMQMAQLTQKASTPSTPAQLPTNSGVLAQDQQVQTLLNAMRGQGGSVDLMA
jgi:hypothetical protein